MKRTAQEIKLIEATIEAGVEYIKNDDCDICQARQDYTYPLISDNAQSYWSVEGYKEKLARGNRHRILTSHEGFTGKTFIYAHGVFEGFKGRTMRLILNYIKEASGEIVKVDYEWEDVT